MYLVIILTFPLIIGVFLWVRREVLDLTEAQFLFLEVICFSSFYFEIYFVMKNKFLFVVFAPRVVLAINKFASSS